VESLVGKPDRVLASAADLTARGIWFFWSIVVGLVTVGLPLAVVGWFVPWLVIPGTVVLAAWFYRLVEPHVDLASIRDRSTAALFLVAAAAVALMTITNLAYSGQHHATNRDPGVYLETGLWLADNGSVVIDGRQGPFLERDELRGGGLGFEELNDGSGRLYSQFGHATAVVLAAGSWLGGAASATRVPAVLMALALMLWWFAIKAVTDHRWATVGVSAMALNLVILHVSRDTFSEPLALALVAGAVVLLSSTPRPGRWLLAGWAIGIAVSARVDMTVVAFGAMLLATTMVRRRRDTALFIAAVVTGTGLSFVDLRLRSPDYLSDRWSALLPVMAAGAAVAVGALIVMAAGNRHPNVWVRRRLGSSRSTVKWLGVLSIIGVAVYALYVRPHMGQQHSGFSGHIAGLQSRDGLAVDGTRTYGERAAVWLTWYMGIPAVALAVAGAATFWTKLLDRRHALLLPAISLMGPLTLLYLQRPRITGDQIWALRRFVPAAIPLMILLACLAGFQLMVTLRPRLNRLGQALMFTIISALLIIPAAAVTWPLRTDRTMLWPTQRIEALCDVLGPDSAVLVSSEQLLGDHLIRTVARTCDLPTARADLSQVDLETLSSEWRSAGRDLLVVTYAGEVVNGATPVSAFDMPQQMLEAAVERRPAKIEAGTRVLTIWYAAPGPNSG